MHLSKRVYSICMHVPDLQQFPVSYFHWSWQRRAWKSPYVLCPVSQQYPQHCPQTSANVCLAEHWLFLATEDGISATSFLHSSFLQAISAVMLWPVCVQKVPLPSNHLCPVKLQIRCDICFACQSICHFISFDSGMVFAAENCMAMPVRAAHSRLHLLEQVHWACENDGMCKLCITLEGQPHYCVCDCFCLHGQTGGHDSVGTFVLVYSPSTLLDYKASTRPVPCGWAIHVDYNVIWVADGFNKHLSFCTGFSSWPFMLLCAWLLWQQSLMAGLELNWMFFPVPSLL